MTDQSKIYLNHRVSGNGHPVVFLHGFLESIAMWNYLDFVSDFTQVCIDLPGHGDSPFDPENDAAMLSMAELVKKEIDALKLDVYHLIGHSMGGYVALELMKMDGRCDKLVLLNSNFWEDDPQKRKDRERVAEIVLKNKKLFLYEAIPNLFMNPDACDKEVKKLIMEATNIPANVIAAISMGMTEREDNSMLVKKNGDRILIIQGDNDNIISDDKMDERNKMADATLLIMENCGHMAHIERPNKTVQAIRDFLA